MQNTTQEPFKVNRVSIPIKCSYQMNNLACTNEHLVYTNTYDPMRICHYIIKIQDMQASIDFQKNIQLQYEEPINKIQYIQIQGKYYLVVLQFSVITIYSEDGSNILFQIYQPVDGNPQSDPTEIKNYYTDFTIFGYGDTFQEVLCYSTSNGNLKYINFSNNQFQNSTYMISLKQNSINSVYTIKAVPELKCLFLSDKNGQLAKLQFSNIKDFETTIKTPSNNTCPITVMETLHSQNDEWNLVTGDFLGSEDTYLNFWNLNKNNEIQLKVSYRLADQIVLGIQQIQQCKYVFVTTLESQEMTILIQQK